MSKVVITRLEAVTSVNVPDFSQGSPAIGHRAVVLDPPITLWLVSVQDGEHEWSETYASEAEKDAFVRGFKAASAMHGYHEPTIVEFQR